MQNLGFLLACEGSVKRHFFSLHFFKTKIYSYKQETILQICFYSLCVFLFLLSFSGLLLSSPTRVVSVSKSSRTKCTTQNSNWLTDWCIDWLISGNLSNLTTLKVDDNQLTSLPRTLGGSVFCQWSEAKLTSWERSKHKHRWCIVMKYWGFFHLLFLWVSSTSDLTPLLELRMLVMFPRACDIAGKML